MLTPEQQRNSIAAARFVLAFLVDSENRSAARKQMKGFSDPAIFHRWMSLAWTFGDERTVALLSAQEKDLLREFTAIYESIPWTPIEGLPFVRDTSENELIRLIPVASKLLQSLSSPTQRNLEG